jgi:hypothetical protein
MIMGAGGRALCAPYTAFISPQDMAPILTFQIWAMLIVGGAGNNRGALLGAFLIWGVWTLSGFALARFAPADWQLYAGSIQYILIGSVIVGMLMWRPAGAATGTDFHPSHQIGRTGRNHQQGSNLTMKLGYTGLAGAAALAVMAHAGTASAQACSVDVGVIYPTSVDWGMPIAETALWVAGMINEAGGVDGCTVNPILRDDQNDARVGVDAARALVDLDRVQLLIGTPFPPV